jgi:uncharacterized membrane protein/protein-disulfide isomerase
MTRRTGLVLFLLALLALGASISASVVHYKLLMDRTYHSVCDINQTWNCSDLYESRYGAFYGVPVAVGGVIWSAAVTLLAAAGLRAAARPAGGERGSVAGYIFILAIVGLSSVLYLGYASFFVIKTYCVFCLLTYIAVVGIFLVSGTAADGSMTDLPRRAVRDLKALVTSPVGLLASGLFVAGAIALVMFFPRQVDATTAAPAAAAAPAATLDAAQESEFEKWYTTLPRVPLAVPTDGAKVLIVKFNDYQCPPCRMTYEQYKPIIAKYEGLYPGKVKFVTKDYPLDPKCNANVPNGMHPSSCEAAVAVRLAKAKGRGEAMEEWLFSNQPQMTPDLVKMGVRSVAGVEDFDAKYPSTVELVKSDIAMGAALQVHATPTFFINGVRIPVVKPEYFDKAIQYELSH